MSRKFGKFMLTAAAVTTAAAAAYYFSQKKKADTEPDFDEDFDDFSDDGDEDTDHSYVELDMEGSEEKKKVDLEEMASKGKTIHELRAKVIAFRDYMADGDKAMLFPELIDFASA